MTLATSPSAVPPRPSIKLTQADHGRRMTLAEFDTIEVDEGVFAELAKGVVEVSDVPGLMHSDIQEYLRDLIAYYKRERPGVIRKVAMDTGSKTVIVATESERHPDLVIYLTEPPSESQPWADWTPDIVVEIVSESSRQRDYVAKLIDYWQAGVGEYWIVDPQWAQVQLCRRATDDWAITVLRGRQVVTSERLDGFSVTVAALFERPPVT